MIEPEPALHRRVDTGNAELHRDPEALNGWILFVNDIAQSYVDLDVPEHLEFDYTRWIATVVDSIAKPGAPLRVLHLGGGAMSLPRYIAATRPGSVQHVVEVDQRLAAFVDEKLPLPDGTGIEVILDDASTVLADWPADDLDLVITDAFRAARMPEKLTGTQSVAAAARALDDGGTYIVNIIDVPPYLRWRTHAEILVTTFADVGVIAGHDRRPHPRFDNIIVAASHATGRLSPARLREAAERHETRVAPAIGDALRAMLDAPPVHR